MILCAIGVLLFTHSSHVKSIRVINVGHVPPFHTSDFSNLEKSNQIQANDFGDLQNGIDHKSKDLLDWMPVFPFSEQQQRTKYKMKDEAKDVVRRLKVYPPHTIDKTFDVFGDVISNIINIKAETVKDTL